jgi:aryl-alcohol dehydrogenase-like predicted oxidoreductase
VSRAQIALAWVPQQPAVTAPIIGVTKTHHLDDAIASLSITLTDAELAKLNDPYVPRLPEGFE